MSGTIDTIGSGAGGAPIGPATSKQASAVPLFGAGPAQPATDVLQRAAQHVTAAMGSGGVSFSFIIDKQSGMTIVKIFNKDTGELVRQIPSEEVVHVAQLLRQDEQRSLLDLKV